MAGIAGIFRGAHPGVAGGGVVAGIGVRGGGDLRAFDRDGFEPGGVQGLVAVANPPSISRSSAAASWQLYPCLKPPPDRERGARVGDVELVKSFV